MISTRKEREKVRQSGITFLRSEIDTAHTLADIALGSSNNLEKRERNVENARKAYDSFKRFSDRMALTSDETRELNGDLESLKSKLARLGEKVD